MIKKIIKYVDYNGTEREEAFYFNLSDAEITEMDIIENGGLKELLEKIVQEKDGAKILDYFKKIVLMSYGEKSPDGKYFVKNEEIRNKFISTEAYSVLFMELATDDKAASDFINGVISENAKKDLKESKPNLTPTKPDLVLNGD